MRSFGHKTHSLIGNSCYWKEIPDTVWKFLLKEEYVSNRKDFFLLNKLSAVMKLYLPQKEKFLMGNGQLFSVLVTYEIMSK